MPLYQWYFGQLKTIKTTDVNSHTTGVTYNSMPLSIPMDNDFTVSAEAEFRIEHLGDDLSLIFENMY
jgi:hypothetical protein